MEVKPPLDPLPLSGIKRIPCAPRQAFLHAFCAFITGTVVEIDRVLQPSAEAAFLANNDFVATAFRAKLNDLLRSVLRHAEIVIVNRLKARRVEFAFTAFA